MSGQHERERGDRDRHNAREQSPPDPRKEHRRKCLRLILFAGFAKANLGGSIGIAQAVG